MEPCACGRTASSMAETSGCHRRADDEPLLSAHEAERRETCGVEEGGVGETVVEEAVVGEGGVDEGGGERCWSAPSAEPLN